MGYNTCFHLDVKIPAEDHNKYSRDDIIEDLRDTYEWAGAALDEYGGTQEPCKWYESNEELIEFSKKYLDVLFTLEGFGENNDDMWRLFVQNGKSQYTLAKIIFDEYDPSKLE